MTNATQIRIERLYVSPGHNFFGHHSAPPGEHPMLERAEIQCQAGRGIVGDRFFDFKPGYKGQVTFFAMEILEDVCRRIGAVGKSPGLVRRNVITSGVDLNSWIGREFEIQGVRFAGTEECRPCHWMDQALAPGAEEAMRGCGGLRARILTNGTLRRSP